MRPILEVKPENWSAARGSDFKSNDGGIIDCELGKRFAVHLPRLGLTDLFQRAEGIAEQPQSC